MSARIVSRLGAFVTVLAVIRSLDDAHYGQFTALVTYTALTTVLVDLGFNTLYIREAARHPAEISRYLSNLVSLRLLSSVLALLVLAGALQVAGLYPLLVPGFVLMVLNSYANLLRGTFYAMQRLGFEAVAIVLESVILLGLVLYGAMSHMPVAFFIWAYAASYGFSCVFFLAVLLGRRTVRLGWRLEIDFITRWLWSGLPFALTFVITTLYFKIDVPILQYFRGLTEVGWYGAAYKPFEALLFVPLTMLQVVFPVLSALHHDSPGRMPEAVARFFRILLLAGWPAGVGMFVLAPDLSRLLFPYPQSEPALEILSIAIVFMFVNNAFIGALSSIDRQWLFTWAALISLAANLLLNLALIPTYGYLGAAWATVATEAVLVIAGWAFTARQLGRVPVWRPSWKILIAGSVMGLALYPLRGRYGLWVLAAIAAGALVYASAIWLLRAVDEEEVALARRLLGRPA
jgi:O-antigen/teichoic acid export membrane protein